MLKPCLWRYLVSVEEIIIKLSTFAFIKVERLNTRVYDVIGSEIYDNDSLSDSNIPSYFLDMQLEPT